MHLKTKIKHNSFFKATYGQFIIHDFFVFLQNNIKLKKITNE